MIHHRFFQMAVRPFQAVFREFIPETSLRKQKAFRPLYVVLLITALLAGAGCACHATQKRTPIPDVLILVMSGLGPYDNVSINYASEVSDKDVDTDIRNLIVATHWQIKDAKETTETPNVPGAKPTTAVGFVTPRIVAMKDGILPIEPFVDIFKRYKIIQVNYLIQSPFKFAGLRDFENDFVKVSLKTMGNSYQYTVLVKNNDFDRADLPLRSGTGAASRSVKGMHVFTRIIFIVGIALLVSVFVYFVAAYMCRRRRAGE